MHPGSSTAESGILHWCCPLPHPHHSHPAIDTDLGGVATKQKTVWLGTMKSMGKGAKWGPGEATWPTLPAPAHIPHLTWPCFSGSLHHNPWELVKCNPRALPRPTKSELQGVRAQGFPSFTCSLLYVYDEDHTVKKSLTAYSRLNWPDLNAVTSPVYQCLPGPHPKGSMKCSLSPWGDYGLIGR